MRHFGLEEANRLVPMLNQLFERVRPWAAQAQKLSEELEPLQGQRDAHTERLRGEYEALLGKIREELLPLQEMGIEVKAADGLVDFRALLAGRTVYLCWRYGEPTVSHWHELEAGFAGRQPIRNPGEFTPTYLS